MSISLLTFNNARERYLKRRVFQEKTTLILPFDFSFQREQLAAVTAIANHHRLSSSPPPPTIDDPDVNVVDLDDGIEKSTSGTTTSLSCQESFNSDQRYSPSAQTDISYTKSPTAAEIDPPKCVVCMVSCENSNQFK